MKFNISRLCSIVFVSGFVCQAPGAVLTGAFVSMLEATGSATGDSWDTRAERVGGFYYNLWFTRGAPGGTPNGLETPFINGPDNSRASIAILLNPGTNKFTIYGDSGGGGAHYGLVGVNLFLDGHIVPDISGKAEKRTDSALPPVSPNSSPFSLAMDGSLVPAAGTLEYSNRTERVVLLEFSWASPGVIPSNRVSPYEANGADASTDYIGTVTLVVYPTADLPLIRVSEVEVSWYSVNGASYQVFYRSEATTNIWNPVGPLVEGSGDRMSLRDPVAEGESQRFYRVLRVP